MLLSGGHNFWGLPTMGTLWWLNWDDWCFILSFILSLFHMDVDIDVAVPGLDYE